ncbi:MAG: polysaccharide deacetylase family protein [Halarcobacter sp.]
MKTVFLLICILSTAIFANEKVQIKEYKIVNKSVINENKYYTILRSFSIDDKKYFLVVDENSLQTKVLKKEYFFKARENKLNNSKYKKLLNQYSKPIFTLKNYGLKHINSNSIYLTVDLCPSSKSGYEDSFFNSLNKIYQKHRDIPISIFISGKWIDKHEKQFLELLSLQKKGILDITWGNHTYNHPYNKKLPLEKNFLLIDKTNIIDEVLDLEKLLLSYGLTPSILFRFPGLISDKKSSLLINSLGLIPVGSDTWLAKNEMIKQGSLVLIHGNKNEPKGIIKFNEFLQKNKTYLFGSILDDLNP